MTRARLLYTEMITTGAVLHGDRARLLRFDPWEHPVAFSSAAAIGRARGVGADLPGPRL